MDQISVDPARMTAGADFLKALDNLGLRTTALFWAYDKNFSQFNLVLVTPFLDVAGPLVLSEKLVAAYRAAATPREIDPFIVRIHSPKQSFVRSLAQLYGAKMVIHAVDKETGKLTEHPNVGTRVFNISDLEIHESWVYRFRDLDNMKIDLVDQWKKFSRKIDKLAA